MAAETEKTPEENFGARVADYRKLRGMTMRELANLASVSVSFLSQLENGKTNASIASLRKIATALGVTPVHLLEPTESVTAGVLKAANRAMIELDGAKKFVLSEPPVRALEVYAGEIEPGGSTGADSYVHGDAQEMFIVTAGAVVLQLGEQEFTLEAGDSIEYRSSVPHRVYNPYEMQAQVIWINTPPTPEAVAVNSVGEVFHV